MQPVNSVVMLAKLDSKLTKQASNSHHIIQYKLR